MKVTPVLSGAVTGRWMHTEHRSDSWRYAATGCWCSRSLGTIQIQELVGFLVGTTGSLPDALGLLFGLDENKLTLSDCWAIDAKMFLCDECGWWCSEEDLFQNSICTECDNA